MPISFTCSWGKKLRAKDEYAGKRVKCPVCARVLVVPFEGPSQLLLRYPLLRETLHPRPPTPPRK